MNWSNFSDFARECLRQIIPVDALCQMVVMYMRPKQLTVDTQIFQDWFVGFFFGSFAHSWQWPQELTHLDAGVSIVTLLIEHPKPMKRKWRQLLSKLKQVPIDNNDSLSFTLCCFTHDYVASVVPSLSIPEHPQKWLRGDIWLGLE